MGLLNWLHTDWFVFLQSLGIVGSLLFTGISLRIDSRVRNISNSLKLVAQHREIWTQLFERPELKRVKDSSVDLSAQPVTAEEELFVKLLILHLNAAYETTKAGMVMAPNELQADIASFFSLPIPRVVWEQNKRFHASEFLQFVEENRRRASVAKT